MTRDEVLSQLDDVTNSAFAGAVVSADVCRVAAELIRASGWRPIAEAPEGEWLFVGKPTLTGWFPFSANKAGAIANGYTHYLPMPEPPEREVPNDGE